MKRLSGFHPTALALFAGVIMLASVAWSEVAKLSSITLEQKDQASTYVIACSGDVHHQDFLMSNPPRLVLDIMGAQNALDKMTQAGDGKLVKNVRTSQFTSDPEMVTRVVFDLEEDTRYRVDKKGNSIEVSFFSAQAPRVMGADMGGGWDPTPGEVPVKTTTPKPSDTAPVTKTSPAASTPVVSTPAAPAPATKTTTPAPVRSNDERPSQPVSSWNAVVEAPKPSTPAPGWNSTDNDGTEVAMASRASQVQSTVAMGATGSMLSNKPITLDVQGADIKTVLRSISEFSGANIVAGPEVEGTVTIHLVNVPWQEALDTILRANGYDYRDEYGIYRVQESKVLQNEEIDQVTLQRKKEEMQPLVSKVVKLSYANAKEIATAMKDATTRRGSVQVEPGTNSVIITDIPSYVENVSALAVDLDRRVSQVEIVAKLVDVDMEATREMGIKWDFLNLQSADINGNASASIGQTLVDPYGSFRVGTVHSWGDLMVALDALEKENKANIVSHPRITTADNSEASILVGKEIPLIVSDEAGNPITELKKIGVILRVTPHINSDQTITMDIHPEVSELSSQATVQGGVIISLTQADTRVIVKDGETAVIGGLINEVESHNDAGLPLLKDVPVFGNLFKYSNKVKKKRELIIFITPKVVG
jgi:type IV pilus assembly protein PilQ